MARTSPYVDAFGHVNRIFYDLASGYKPQGKHTIKTDEVTAKIAEQAYGNMAAEDWDHLRINFRLLLPPNYAEMRWLMRL